MQTLETAPAKESETQSPEVSPAKDSWLVAIHWGPEIQKTLLDKGADGWERWHGSETDAEQLGRIALHAAIRKRGGVQPYELLPVWVLVRRDSWPTAAVFCYTLSRVES
jgi:hypothetical protein